MTPADIRTLSADVLPRMLAAAGFAPLGAHIDVTITDYLRALHYSPDLWQPHLRWDHAMPLLDVMHAQGWMTSISYVTARPEGQRRHMEAFSCRGHHGLHFTEGHGPEALCRLVLMVHYAPCYYEMEPDAFDNSVEEGATS